MLTRALNSVNGQLLLPAVVHVEMDTTGSGAAPTRHRGLMAVRTPWVAFLDSDDLFKAMHLRNMLRHAKETGADFVYSWFEMSGGRDPFPDTHFSNDWDPNNPIETTVTTLIRTGLAQEVGFHVQMEEGGTNPGHNSGEDRGMTLGCMRAGAMISHLKERTWIWTHHGGNTSGLPGRGDAR